MNSKAVQIANPTCCGAQAIISGYYSQNDFDILNFEILTSVPFAITHKYNQTKRLIESFIDHDIGIQRAFENINIVSKKKFWKNNEDTAIIIKSLKDAIDRQPVVLGPLNMDGLNYLYHNELYSKMNHYVIAMGYDNNNFYITDTEGYPLVIINETSLIDAWCGARIIEGKGSFIMQYVTSKSIKININQLLHTLNFAAINYENALQQENSAGDALLQVYKMRETLKTNPSLQNRLSYDIPLRIQRNLLIVKFVFLLHSQLNQSLNYIQLIENNIKTQNICYANILQSILERSDINFNLFLELSDYEDDVSKMIINLNKELK